MQYNLIYSVSFNKEFWLQPTRFIWQSTHGLLCAVWETCCWVMQISRVVPAGSCFPFSSQDLGHERCSLPARADLKCPLVLIILFPFSSQFSINHFPLLCRRPGLDPWVGKIPWRKVRLPTPVFWPGEFHGLYSPWGRKKSDMIEWLSVSLWFSCLVYILPFLMAKFFKIVTDVESEVLFWNKQNYAALLPLLV